MDGLWYGLLANLGVVAIFMALWTYIQDFNDRWPEPFRTGTPAVLMAAGTVATMLVPFDLLPGIKLDLRTTLIAVAGFFGGPVVGIVAALGGSLFRLYLGGLGAIAGVAGICLAAMIGIGGRHLVRGRAVRIVDLAIMAVALSASGVLGFLFLPGDLWRDAISLSFVPRSTITIVSTLISGIAMQQAIARRAVGSVNQMYRAIIDALPDALNAKDLDGRFLAANPATARLMRAPGVDSLIGHGDFDFYPEATAREFRAYEERVMAAGVSSTVEQLLTRQDGTKEWLSTLKAPLYDANGQPIGLLSHNRDISYRKSLELKLAEGQQRLADALAHMADGLAMFAADGRLLLCNEQYRTLFPATADLRVPGADLRDILRAGVERGEEVVTPGMDIEAWIDEVVGLLGIAGDREILTLDGRFLHARVRPTGDGKCLTLVTDITREKRAARALADANIRLAQAAKTDGLTGLLNRGAFDAELARELSRSARAVSPLSLVLIDVDRFKPFNDTYGHPAGDECLRAVASCLRSALKRPADIAARYGGEELVALLPDTDEDGAIRLAQAFREAVRALNIPHAGSEKGRVTISAGVASLGIARTDAAELVLHADEALYAAKGAGRDSVRVWTRRETEARRAAASG